MTPTSHLKRCRSEHTNSLPDVKMADSKKRSNDDGLADALQARLAAAEQDVVVALGLKDYDELIAIASNALEAKADTMTKNSIKSRKNLLWARSKAYQHKSLHKLALRDAKAVLTIDPDDVAAYIQTAAVLKDAGHTEQARGCLDKAAASAEKYDQTTRETWLRRLQRQTRKILGGSLMNRLPNEMLIEVALYLDTSDRVAMSQTCRSWRQILVSSPCLWTSLTVKAKPTTTVGAVTEAMAVKRLNIIDAAAQKAHHRLEHVQLFVQFPKAFLDRALAILRLSAETLTHIDIETGALQDCYESLYRHCPRLKSLVIRLPWDMQFGNVSNSTFEDKLTQDKEPFSLESLSVASGVLHHRFLLRHLRKARSLQRYNPFMRLDPAQPDYAADVEILRSLTEHLEQWTDVACVHRPRARQRAAAAEPMSLTFPKLIKVSNLHMLDSFRFILPIVEDLSLSLEESVRDAQGSLAAQTLRSSPMIRKLGLYDGTLREEDHAILRALQELRYLEVLDLGSSRLSTLIFLLPRRTVVGSESAVYFPLLKLREVTLNAYRLDLRALAHTLLIRDYVQAGEGLITARRKAANTLEILQAGTAKAPNIAPFERGSSQSQRNGPQESFRQEDDPRLKDASECCRLRTLRLVGVVGIEDDVKEAIRLVVADLQIEYEPL